MKNKPRTKFLTFSIILAISAIFHSCGETPPLLFVDPQLVSKIYKEDGGIYCYFAVTNLSKYQCQFEVSDPTYLTRSSPAPPSVLAPYQVIEFKYEVTGWNENSICPYNNGTMPCIFDSLRMRAKWDGYITTDGPDEEKVLVEWTQPETQANCWVPDGNSGENDNFYQAELCTYTAPDRNKNTGHVYMWGDIDEIHNPNDFDFKVLVKESSADCIKAGGVLCADKSGEWVDVLAHSSIRFGDIFRTKGFKEFCFNANPANAYVCSNSGRYSEIGDGLKWIALRVSVIPCSPHCSVPP